MGEGKVGGFRRVVFAVWVTVIALVVAAQSVVQLVVVLGTGRIGTFVDLDRSNGLPDIVSTIALGSAAVGAAMLARAAARSRGGADVSSAVPALLAVVLAVVTLADALHDGAHPSSTDGWLVIGVVCVAGVLLALTLVSSGLRARAVVIVAGLLLAASFLVNGLDRLDHRFERARGEAIAEYQIVAKEGLELLGWSLVALAVWDEGFRRLPAPVAVSTGRASRGRAASRRRAA